MAAKQAEFSLLIGYQPAGYEGDAHFDQERWDDPLDVPGKKIRHGRADGACPDGFFFAQIGYGDQG